MQVIATVPVKPPTGVIVSGKPAATPCCTVVDEVLPPLTVSVKLPPSIPVPVSGTVSGEAGSLLAMVSAPLRVPVCRGVKVTVSEQEEPAFNVTGPQVLAAV